MAVHAVPDRPAIRWTPLQVLSPRPDLGVPRLVADRAWDRHRTVLVAPPPNADLDTFVQRAQAWFDHGLHAAIVPCYGLIRVDGELRLWLDGAPGVPLTHGAQWAPDEVLRIAAPVAAALGHAHDRGWWHGDVCLTNLYVTESGAMLGGFLSQEPRDVPAIRAPGAAPEVWARPGWGPAADVYAFGVVLFELLTGQPPFRVDDAARAAWVDQLRRADGTLGRWVASFTGRVRVEGLGRDEVDLLMSPTLDAAQRLRLLAALHRSLMPPSLRAIRPEISPELEALVLSCLDKVPSRRPTAHQILQGLMDCGAALPATAPSIDALNNRALALVELGEPEAARAPLGLALERSPTALIPWVNLRLIEIAEDPDRLFDVVEEFESVIRPAWGRSLHSSPALTAFVDFLETHVLDLNGPVRSVSFAPDGRSVAIAGRFPSGVRVWDIATRSRTRALFGGRTAPCDLVFLLSNEHAIVKAGPRVTMVKLETGESLWSKRFADVVTDAAVTREGRLAIALSDRVLLLDADGAIGGWLGPFDVPADTPLTCIAVTRDGRRIAFAAGARVRVLWVDAERVQADLSLDADVTALAFGADGRALLAGDRTGNVVRVPLDGGAALPSRLYAHDVAVTALDVSPDGEVLGTGDARGLLITLEGGARTVLGQHPAAVRSIAFDQHRNLIAGDDDGRVRVWSRSRIPMPLRFAGAVDDDERTDSGGIPRNVREGTLILRDRGLTGGLILGVLHAGVDWSTRYASEVQGIAFDREERILATCGAVVHLSKGRGRNVDLDAVRFEHDADVLALGFSPDGRQLATGTHLPKGGGGPPKLPGARLVVLSNPSLSFSIGPAGLTIGRDRTRDTVLADEGVSRRHCTILVRDGQYILRDDGSANGVFVNQVRVLEDVLRDGDLLRIGQSQLRFEMADPDDEDDTTTGLLLLKRGAQPPEAGMMAWEEDRDWRNPDDAEAAGPGVQVWATDDGRRAFHVEHPLAVRALAWSPSGHLLATGCDDGRIRIWRASSWIPERVLPIGVGIHGVAFSSDGNRILAACDDGTARVWDVTDGALIHTLRGHRRAVRAAIFGPDGRRILTGGADGVARVWLTRTGACVAELQGHTGAITAVAFSADGRVALTGSADGTARLWDIATGQLLDTIAVDGEGVSTVGFSPDGHRVGTGGAQGTLRIWLVRWLWAFYEDTIGLAEALVADPGGFTCMTWPTPVKKRDFDFWVDVWRDVKRCSDHATLEPGEVSRLLRLRTRIVYLLRDCVLGTAPEVGVPLGLDVFRSPTSERFAAEIRSVLLVDPDLAAELKARLG